MMIAPTSLPSPLSCSKEDNAFSVVGFFDWPETDAKQNVTRDCPHGPEGSLARRECGENGKWKEVDGGKCNNVTATVQTLHTLEMVCVCV